MHVMSGSLSLQSLAFILILVLKGSHESSWKVTGSGGQKCLTCELSEKRKREAGSEVLPNDTSLLVQSVSQLPYTTQHTDLQVSMSGKEEEANLMELDLNCACPDQEWVTRASTTSGDSDGERHIQKTPWIPQSSTLKTCPCPATQNKDGEEKAKSTLVEKKPNSPDNNTQLQILQKAYFRTTRKVLQIPTFPCETNYSGGESSGRQCPVCKTKGFQDCQGQLTYCKSENNLCLTLFGQVRIGKDNQNITLKCCTDTEHCEQTFTEFESHPVNIVKKSCVVAPSKLSGSPGGASPAGALLLVALLQSMPLS